MLVNISNVDVDVNVIVNVDSFHPICCGHPASRYRSTSVSCVVELPHEFKHRLVRGSPAVHVKAVGRLNIGVSNVVWAIPGDVEARPLPQLIIAKSRMV
jgi:hypothetical protein